MELKEGRKVKSAYLDADPHGNPVTWDDSYTDIKSMVISHENGEMAPVPWLKVERDNGTVQMLNCAKLTDLVLYP